MPQLGSCGSSGRASRLWAARHSQGEASPLGAQPLPRVLERAASQAAYFTAFDHSGPGRVVSVLEGISNPCFNPGPCFNPDPCFNPNPDPCFHPDPSPTPNQVLEGGYGVYEFCKASESGWAISRAQLGENVAAHLSALAGVNPRPQ